MLIRSDEEVIERLSYRLHRFWLPTTRELVLAVALDELHDWLLDDHWWRNGSDAGWLALLREVEAAVDMLPVRLRQVADSQLAA